MLARWNSPTRFFITRPVSNTLSSSNIPQRQWRGKREYGADSNSWKHDDNSWDHVFEGIDSGVPKNRQDVSIPLAVAPPPNRRPQRRKAMTAREISAFDNMFDMIFAAVNKQKELGPSDAREAGTSDFSSPGEPSSSGSASTADMPSSSPQDTETATPPALEQAIGRAPSGPMADFFGKLRHQSNRMRRTSEDDELLDRRKEEMRLCDTDQELLAWAARVVFREPPESPPESAPESRTPEPELAHYLADPTYPHVLAHLMQVFRTKYRAPHTALALFAHAKRRSIHSYVFGCTAPAYNERLAALWQLEGSTGLDNIEAVLIEMGANGIAIDAQTRALVERVREGVGKCVLGREDDGATEVWDTLARVEALVRRKSDNRHQRRDGEGGSGKRKLDAKRRHWDQEWKRKEDPNLGEDRLTLQP